MVAVAASMTLDELIELVDTVDALLVAVAESLPAFLLRLAQHAPDRVQACWNMPLATCATHCGPVAPGKSINAYPCPSPRAVAQMTGAQSGGTGSGRGYDGARG